MQSRAGKIYLLGLVVHAAQTELQPAGQTPQVLAAGSTTSSSERVPSPFTAAGICFSICQQGGFLFWEKALDSRVKKNAWWLLNQNDLLCYLLFLCRGGNEDED